MYEEFWLSHTKLMTCKFVYSYPVRLQAHGCILFMLCIYPLLIYTCIGDASLTSNAERPCPDDIVVFTCEVSGTDLSWNVFASNNTLVAQFDYNVSALVNSQDSMSGFIATLQSRTPDSGLTMSTLTTTASAQINGYTVDCSNNMLVVGNKTIQLAGELSGFQARFL